MIVAFIIAVIVVLLDQITKLIVLINVSEGDSIYLVNKFLYITKTFNTGAGWSIMDDNTIILLAISCAATAILSYIIVKYIKSFINQKLLTISLGFILGGCFGNLIDRFLTVIHQRDGVVDFVGMWIGKYQWPIWNIADAFLVVGIIILAIWMLFFTDKKEKTND